MFCHVMRNMKRLTEWQIKYDIIPAVNETTWSGGQVHRGLPVQPTLDVCCHSNLCRPPCCPLEPGSPSAPSQPGKYTLPES